MSVQRNGTLIVWMFMFGLASGGCSVADIDLRDRLVGAWYTKDLSRIAHPGDAKSFSMIFTERGMVVYFDGAVGEHDIEAGVHGYRVEGDQIVMGLAEDRYVARIEGSTLHLFPIPAGADQPERKAWVFLRAARESGKR